MEQHLNLNGRDTSLIWTYSQVGCKCYFHSQRATLHALRSRCTARVYSAGDDSKRVTRVSQFTTVKQVRERKIEKKSHVASGVENGQVARPFAECGTLSYFRRCASSSLGLFTGLCGVVACRFPSLSIPRSLFLASSL